MPFEKQSPRGVLQKSCSYNFCKIQRKTPVPDLFFNKIAGLSLQHYEKRDSGTGIFL